MGKFYAQKFRSEWMKNPMLKDWVCEDPNNRLRAYCKYCKCGVISKLSDLFKHMNTRKHAKSGGMNMEESSQSFQNFTSSVFDDSSAEIKEQKHEIWSDQDDPLTSEQETSTPSGTKAETNTTTVHTTLNLPIKRTTSSKMLSALNSTQEFATLSVTTPKPFVFHVELNRPNKFNAINKEMWAEIKTCIEELSVNPDCRSIVLSASGKHFTAGIDISDIMKLGQELADVEDVARKGVVLERLIKLYQDSMTSLEACPKPVIVAVHSACIGAGVDLITAADIRYCTEDAFFQVKEVEIGMAADVGTLQRFPKAIGSQSLARELCYTGRPFKSSEAHSCGLISRVFPDKEALLKGALKLAENIAEKSPIAVQATKTNIVYSLSRPNQQGLDQIREMNKLYLQSEDFMNAAAAQLSKAEKPTFSKL